MARVDAILDGKLRQQLSHQNQAVNSAPKRMLMAVMGMMGATSVWDAVRRMEGSIRRRFKRQWGSGGRYMPHQGRQECERRLRRGEGMSLDQHDSVLKLEWRLSAVPWAKCGLCVRSNEAKRLGLCS